MGHGGLVQVQLGDQLLLGQARAAADMADEQMLGGVQIRIPQGLPAVHLAASPDAQDIAQNAAVHGTASFPFPFLSSSIRRLVV